MSQRPLTILLSAHSNHERIYAGLIALGHTVILNSSDLFREYFIESQRRTQPDIDVKMEGWTEEIASLPEKRSFVLSGQDVSREVYSLYFQTIIPGVRHLAIMADAIRRLHQDHQLDFCLVHNEEAPNLRIMVSTCKAMGIPTLHVTHGAFFESHHLWNFHDRIRTDKAAVECEMSGKEWFGSKSYNQAEQVVVTGRPEWDYYALTEPPVRAEVCQSNGLDPSRPTFGLVGCWVGPNTRGWMKHAEDGLEHVFMAIKALPEPRPQVVIRPHPGHQYSGTFGPEVYQNMAQKCGIEIHFPDCSLNEFIGLSSVVCSFNSTVNGAALIFDKYVLTVKYNVFAGDDEHWGGSWGGGNWGDWPGIVGCVNDRDDVVAKMNKIFNDQAFRAELDAGREETKVAFNRGNDGRATERIISLIYDMVTEAREKGSQRIVPAEPARDPLDYCRPDAPPLAFENTHSARFLTIPVWTSEQWVQVVVDYLETYRGNRDVALVVRIEPLMDEMVELARSVVSGLITESGIPNHDVPDIVLEASPLGAEQRPGLFTACTAMLSVGCVPATLAEGRACGLPVYELASKCQGEEDYSAKSPSEPTPVGEVGSAPVQTAVAAPVEEALTTSNIPNSPGDHPAISLIVVTYNNAATIEACIQSISRCARSCDELVLIDNGSKDETVSIIKQLIPSLSQQVQFVENQRNIGFSRAVNAGHLLAEHELLMLCNPDTVLTTGCLDRMASCLLSSEEVGAVGPLSGEIAGDQKIGYVTDYRIVLNEEPETVAFKVAQMKTPPRVAPFLVGFALMIRREVFEEIGGLRSDLFAGGDDLALSFELRLAGYKLLIARDTYVHHERGESFKSLNPEIHQYLIAQSYERVYESLYGRLGTDAGNGRHLFGLDWYTPITEVVSLVVIGTGDPDDTISCLENVVQTTKRSLQVLVVADEEQADLTAWAAKQRGLDLSFVVVPVGTRRVDRVNEGIACATQEHIVCLDSSAQLSPGWLANMLAALTLDSDIGMVGPRLASSVDAQHVEDIPYTNAYEFFQFTDDWFIDNAGEVEFSHVLSSSCVLFTRRLVESIGGFDSQYWGQVGADQDLCFRVLRSGLKLVQVNDVFVHNEPCPAEELIGDAVERYDSRVFGAKWGVVPASYEELHGLALSYISTRETAYIDPSMATRLLKPENAADNDASRGNRLLLMPDFEESNWHDTFQYLASAVAAMDNMELMVRVEPLDKQAVDLASSTLQALVTDLRNQGKPVGKIVIHEAILNGSNRFELYSHADAYVPCGGRFASTNELEAICAGLQLIGDADPSADLKSEQEPALV